jgi:hypothetical protein
MTDLDLRRSALQIIEAAIALPGAVRQLGVAAAERRRQIFNFELRFPDRFREFLEVMLQESRRQTHQR